MVASAPRLSFCCIIMIALSSAASSQEERKERSYHDFDPSMFGPLAAVREPAIRKQLYLTEKQSEQINAILDGWSRTFDDYKKLPREKRDRDQLKESMRESETELDKLLSRHQRGWLVILSTSKGMLSISDHSFVYDIRKLRAYQDELKLDEAQRQYVEELFENSMLHSSKWWSDPKNQGKSWKQFRADAGKTWNQEMRDAFVARLKFSQKKRFEQLEFQDECREEGPLVFLRPDIQAELQLTPEQTKSIQSIAESIRDKPLQEEIPARKDGYKKCVRLLTDAQSKILAEKLGELFGLGVGLKIETP